MASYRRIEVKPVAGALGAEIGGVNLGRLDDDTFKEIKAAWLEHLVIFFRDQNITPEQQIAFAKRFGDIHHHPFMKGMDEYPDILEIIKEEGDTKAFGEVWHTDQMFNPKPAKATILYAKETPERRRRHAVHQPVPRLRDAVGADEGACSRTSKPGTSATARS